MSYTKTTFLILILAALSFGCKKYTYKVAYPTLSDGKYDSEFPYKNCSKQLTEIASAVKRVFSIAKYKTYFFTEEDKVTTENVRQKIADKKYYHFYSSDESTAGTGTIILSENRRIAMLTCAHVVSFADTLSTYYNQKGNFGPKYIFSISIKQSQMLFANGLPEDKKLEVLCTDNKNDIAIIGKVLKDVPKFYLPTFNYPVGNSKKLEWGSFTYIVGHPLGRQMITRGIVSSPNLNKDGSYMIDALFNEGISGGLILAVKDGVPNFELVGIARSVSTQHENILVPEKPSHEYVYNSSTPYKEDIYVSLKKKINYGITYAVSSELIKKLYEKNRLELKKKGYYMDTFFNLENK